MTRFAPIAAVGGVVTLISAVAAAGLSALVGASLAPPEAGIGEPAVVAISAPRAATPVVPAGRPPDSDQYLDGIMRRNLFDVQVIETWNPEPVLANEQPLTALDVQLLGTIVANPATMSSAVVRHGRDEVTRMYALGDALEDREVIDITFDRITLRRRDGQEEVLHIDATRTTDTVPGRSTAAEVAEAAPADGRFEVDAATVERTIGSLEGLSRLGRLLPHNGPDGSMDGFQISALRRRSASLDLGLKDGDVIHAVNGVELESANAAADAFQQIDGQESFCFGVKRGEENVELCYDVK